MMAASNGQSLDGSIAGGSHVSICEKCDLPPSVEFFFCFYTWAVSLCRLSIGKSNPCPHRPISILIVSVDNRCSFPRGRKRSGVIKNMTRRRWILNILHEVMIAFFKDWEAHYHDGVHVEIRASFFLVLFPQFAHGTLLKKIKALVLPGTSFLV